MGYLALDIARFQVGNYQEYHLPGIVEHYLAADTEHAVMLHPHIISNLGKKLP